MQFLNSTSKRVEQYRCYRFHGENKGFTIFILQGWIVRVG
jgi:hypothetical protein